MIDQSDQSGTATPAPCPIGFYCLTGVSNPEPCPAGSYGSSQGLRSVGECTYCPGGKYCEGTGMSTFTGPCQAGFYCVERAETAAPASLPQGGGGESSVIPFIFGFGQFLHSQLNMTFIHAQLNLHSRTTKYDLHSRTTGGVCPTGGYCPEGSATPEPCPAGKYNTVSGRTQPTDCIDCPVGQYCSGSSNPAPTGIWGDISFSFRLLSKYQCISR